jgi:hypothetical protein
MKPSKPKAKPNSAPKVSALSNVDARAKELLAKHGCTVGLHAVRARFMGAIASPMEGVKPLDELKALWGGEFPLFETIDEVNALFAALIMGLWNQLIEHNNPMLPFRVTAFKGAPTNSMLREQALVRSQELNAFMEGFYQGQNSMRLSPEVASACEVIDELIPMFEGITRIPDNPNEKASTLVQLAENLDALTEIVQSELNQIITTVASDRSKVDPPAPRTLH